MSVYDYSVKNIQGEDISLKKYEGKVILIVNTAPVPVSEESEGIRRLWQRTQGPGHERTAEEDRQGL